MSLVSLWSFCPLEAIQVKFSFNFEFFSRRFERFWRNLSLVNEVLILSDYNEIQFKDYHGGFYED